MIDISIIIPVYNVEEYIEDCIQSVIHLDIPESLKIECLVVDDCGPDKSMEIAERIISGYEGSILFKILKRDRNGGLSAARNTGLDAAQGRYVYFLDSDDVLTPNAIASLWSVVDKHPGIDLIIGDFEPFPDNGDKAPFMNQLCEDYFSKGNDFHSKYLTLSPLTAWNKLYRRAMLDKNGVRFLEGIIHEDVLFLYQLYNRIKDFGICREKTYLYRQREGSIMSEKNSERSKKSWQTIISTLLRETEQWDRPLVWALIGQTRISKFFANRKGQEEFEFVCKTYIKAIKENSQCPLWVKAIFRIYLSPIGNAIDDLNNYKLNRKVGVKYKRKK